MDINQTTNSTITNIISSVSQVPHSPTWIAIYIVIIALIVFIIIEAINLYKLSRLERKAKQIQEVNESPKQVTKAWLHKKNLLHRIEQKAGLRKAEDVKQNLVEELRQNLILMLYRNHKAKLYEGVKGDTLEIKQSDETEVEIPISYAKMYELEYGGNTYNIGIAHEDHAGLLPEDVALSAKTWTQIMHSMALNIKNYEAAAKAKMFGATGKMWLMIIGGLILGIILLNQFGLLDKFLPHAATAAAQVAQNATSNATNYTAPHVVIGIQ